MSQGRKVVAEFKTQFEMDTDGGDAIDLLEEQAWDKFASLDQKGLLEFDLIFGKKGE